MFRMTSDIYIGGVKVKPTEVKWKSSVVNLKESCTISLPLKGHSRRADGKEQSRLESEFNVGDSVEVKLGYNGNNVERFSGFVSDISVGVPMIIECEGWDYKLHRKYYTRSFKSVTLKGLLKDMFLGTGIEVSPYCADVTITNVTFKEAPYEKIFEWLKKELLLSVSFHGRMFYAGITRYYQSGRERNFRIGYNVINEGDLKERQKTENIKVEVRHKSKYGSVTSYKNEMHNYDSTRSYNVRSGLDKKFYQDLQKEMSSREFANGFEGSLQLFLDPDVSKGDIIYLEDPIYGIRGGSYFVESVDGSFGPGGGRQKIVVRNYNPGKK